VIPSGWNDEGLGADMAELESEIISLYGYHCQSWKDCFGHRPVFPAVHVRWAFIVSPLPEEMYIADRVLFPSCSIPPLHPWIMLALHDIGLNEQKEMGAGRECRRARKGNRGGACYSQGEWGEQCQVSRGRLAGL
jgi:hypothetical protein